MIGVCIVTYNQEKFISQAIDSAISQKLLKHKVRVYIGNDASTDGTAEVCRKYADLYPNEVVLINNQHNLGLVGNTLNVLTRINKDGCEYVAMLDGDDFWCDENKLQKQVSFLESSKDYGFCHTRVYTQIQGRLIEEEGAAPPQGEVFSQIGTFGIGNCSVMFRSELLDLLNFDELREQNFMSIDFVMYAVFSAHTNLGFLDEYTAVWRRDQVSVSNPQNEAKQIAYLENDRRMWRYLGDLYPERWHFNDEAWENYYNSRVFAIAFKFKDYELAHSLLPKFNSRRVSKVKRIVASNKFLFNLWFGLKQRKESLS